MLLSDLIETLQTIFATNGDLDVVCGLDRSGYGEDISYVNVTEAHLFNDETNAYDTDTRACLDLVLTETSIYSTTPE